MRISPIFTRAAGASILGLASLTTPVLLQATAAQDAGTAQNVIFYMGDGMGEAHRDAGQLVGVGLTGTLVMDSLPVVGMVGTNAVGDEWITDSAAAATSYATGVKTTNGTVGLDADGQSVANLVELAKAAGKSVGLVTTSQVTDASPAAFGSHVENRSEQSEIARQLIEDAQVDVILGGGEDRWLPEGTPGAFPDAPAEDPEEMSSSDQGDLIARAQELGYAYVSDAAALDGATGPKVLGLFANEEMFQQLPEGQGIYEPVVSLDQMTAKAIEILSQDPDGFFLFVEEEAIDEMSHANNADLTIKGVLELDKAVQLGVDFATTNTNTLVLVTADHECGGMTIETLNDPEEMDESGAGGTYVAEDMMATPTGEMSGEAALTSGEDGPFPIAGSDQQLVVDWTTAGHTAVRVPLTAMGPGSEQLAGYYENTEVFTALRDAMGLTDVATPTSVETTPVG